MVNTLHLYSFIALPWLHRLRYPSLCVSHTINVIYLFNVFYPWLVSLPFRPFRNITGWPGSLCGFYTTSIGETILNCSIVQHFEKVSNLCCKDDLLARVGGIVWEGCSALSNMAWCHFHLPTSSNFQLVWPRSAQSLALLIPCLATSPSPPRRLGPVRQQS